MLQTTPPPATAAVQQAAPAPAPSPAPTPEASSKIAAQFAAQVAATLDNKTAGSPVAPQQVTEQACAVVE